IGEQGFSGDGGTAVGARLNYPAGVAIDPAGNLYISDQGNNRIRRVSFDGRITTVIGSGVRGFAGDGGPLEAAQLSSPSTLAFDQAGNLYILDRGNGRVRKVILP
ncbi:MAG: hypothetical protein ABIZ80_13535, partial [Bryobacteraceae bacterium]